MDSPLNVANREIKQENVQPHQSAHQVSSSSKSNPPSRNPSRKNPSRKNRPRKNRQAKVSSSSCKINRSNENVQNVNPNSNLPHLISLKLYQSAMKAAGMNQSVMNAVSMNRANANPSGKNPSWKNLSGKNRARRNRPGKNPNQNAQSVNKSSLSNLQSLPFSLPDGMPRSCRQCYEIFPDEMKLNVHIFMEHPVVNKSSAILRCAWCRLPFSYAFDLTAHLEKNHSFYECTMCKLSFTTSHDFRNHLSRIVHHTEDPATAECGFCGWTFVNDSHGRNRIHSHLMEQHFSGQIFSPQQLIELIQANEIQNEQPEIEFDFDCEGELAKLWD